MTRARWQDRALVFSPVYYSLCTNEQQFHRELKHLNLPRDQYPAFLKTDKANATVHFFESSGGKLCAIVCIGKTKGRTLIEVHGLLVHEAIHIWQEVRIAIGETAPSKEFEAYSVQTIAQNLFEAYRLEISRKK